MVLIPRNEEEYLLALPLIEGFDLDQSIIKIMDREIPPLYKEAIEPGQKMVFFSIPRGTKDGILKLKDGNQIPISTLFPEKEPENRFILARANEEYKYQGGKIIYEGSYKASFDYRESKEDTIHSLPIQESGLTYLSFSFKNHQGDYQKLLKNSENAKLIFFDNVVKQMNVFKVVKGWGINFGDLMITFDEIPISQTRFYIYVPGFGIFDCTAS